MSRKIIVQGNPINISSKGEQDYICLTDMVKTFEDGNGLIENWLRNKNTVEFLGIWEMLHNPVFNSVEFDGIKMQVGLNRFKLSVKQWIERTNAIGITAQAGRYGGTYADKDIAYHFGMWLSPEFYLLVVKEFQRLKEEESLRNSLEWQEKRFLSKVAYRLQTDAIKEYIIPELNLPKEKEWLVYAQEADIINIAVFGCTAQEWEKNNPEKALKGENMRDSADLIQLITVTTTEALNKEFIRAGLPKERRLQMLRQSAIENMKSLSGSPSVQQRQKQIDAQNFSNFDNPPKKHLTAIQNQTNKKSPNQ